MKTWSDDNPKAGLMARKRALLIDAALNAFLNTGYAESSVNCIAADAGVSIKTLYRHFQGKDELFSAVMQAACTRTAGSELPVWHSKPPPAGLRLAGEEYLRHTFSDEQLALYRVVIRDAARFPELGQRYREEVIDRQQLLMISYLDRWQEDAGWKIKEKRDVAAVFAALLRAGIFERLLYDGVKPDDTSIVRRARGATQQLVLLLDAGIL